MKHLIRVLILLLFTSCSVYIFEPVTGTYRTKGGFEWGSSISLREDNTFTYFWQTGLIFGKTTGKWQIKDKYLILNSDLKPKIDSTPDFILLEAKNLHSKEIKINLYWPDSTALPGAFGIMYKNKDTIYSHTSDIDGQLIFKKQNFDSLKIQFIGLKDIIILDNVNDNLRILTVDSMEESYEYFNNEKWKIHRDYLIDKTKNTYYYEKKLYKIKK
jgi:hypothetical protein